MSKIKTALNKIWLALDDLELACKDKEIGSLPTAEQEEILTQRNILRVQKTKLYDKFK